MPEMTGPGAAAFDFDLDGDLDLWLTQGHTLPVRTGEDPSDRLLRNLLVERGELRFEDVTEAMGIDAGGYGMGVAVGDYNRDGFPDVFLAQLGANQLWTNLGGQGFENQTVAARLEAPGLWSTGASWIDADGDGHLDLYVVNYNAFSFAGHKTCRTFSGKPDYCGPLAYESLPDQFYRNRGDGTFEDLSRVVGLSDAPGTGLGVATGDFDGDGRLDLYVANDMKPNYLWSVTSGLKFMDQALLAGAAVNHRGKAEASMGIAIGDIDGNAWEDLVITHLDGETHTLYLADGEGGFEDRTTRFQLTSTTVEATGFGTGLADFDVDGDLDLVVANGAVRQIPELIAQGDPHPLGQPNQMFLYHSDPQGGRFLEASDQVDESFTAPEVSRGLCLGDFDNSGSADFLVLNNNGLPRLYLNQIRPSAEGWLGVEVLDEPDTVSGLGSEVIVRFDDDSVHRRTVRRDGSFASSSDPRVLFRTDRQPVELGSPMARWPPAESFPAADRTLSGGPAQRHRGTMNRHLVVLSLLALVASVSCTAPEELPKPPDGIDEFSPIVRRQYDELRARASDALADQADVAESLGRLGQWHHVYAFLGQAATLYERAEVADPDRTEVALFLGHGA